MSEKFDKAWKISLIVILIIGMGLMFWEFNHMNKEGLKCAQSPGEYLTQKGNEQGLNCFYSCTKEMFDSVANISLKS